MRKPKKSGSYARWKGYAWFILGVLIGFAPLNMFATLYLNRPQQPVIVKVPAPLPEIPVQPPPPQPQPVALKIDPPPTARTDNTDGPPKVPEDIGKWLAPDPLERIDKPLKTDITQYAGIPDVVHSYMVAYGKWYTDMLKDLENTADQMPVLIGQWNREKKGGFADRVKFVVNLFTVSLLTRRMFLVDWDDVWPYLHCPYMDWRYSTWKFPIPDDTSLWKEERWQDDFAGKAWQSRNMTVMFSSRMTVIRAMNVPVQNTLSLNVLYKKFWPEWIGHSVTPHQLHGIMQRILFQPTALLSEKLQTYALPKIRPTTQEMVGVHIRTSGEKRSWGDPTRLTSKGHRCLLRCAERVLTHTATVNNQTYNAEKYQIFMATDSNRVVAMAKSSVFNQSHNRDVLLTIDGTKAHLDLTKNAKEREEGLPFIMLDYMMLSEHCDKLVLMQSGFGLLAGWRSLHPYILHTSFNDVACHDETNPKSFAWCPKQYVTEYVPKGKFPFGWIPWKK